MSKFQQQIQRIVKEHGTGYAISQIIAAETEEERRKIQKRWERWPNGYGLETIKLIEQDLASIGDGYEIVIRPIKR